MRTALLASMLAVGSTALAGEAGLPYAVEVISYAPGIGAASGFTNSTAALGEPTRFTGVGIHPSVVSPFSTPFMNDEIVSIGLGGQITLRLGTAAHDRPDNPFGIDLILFSTAFFIDAALPSGVVGGLFGAGEGMIELSDDGTNWHPVPGVAARDAFPTLGYLDAGPFDNEPGKIESDFFLPVDPAIDPDTLIGFDYEALMAVYGASGGGIGIDLADVGLSSANFIRISVAADAPNQIPIDAVTVVPSRNAPVFGDLNGDGIVDGADLGLLLANWSGDGQGDLNRDGVVDGADLGLLLSAWSGRG